MNFLIRNVKRILRMLFCLYKINWIKFFKNYSKKEGVVIVIPGILKNYFINSLELDVINIAVLLKLDKKIDLHFGTDFKGFRNRKICYNPSHLYNRSNKLSHAEFISQLVQAAERNNNKVLLSSYEILFWENKEFMHDQFESLNIRTPKTIIFDTLVTHVGNEYKFPLLVKELHSHASLGVHKCNSEEELNALITFLNPGKQPLKIIIQELLNIKKDLRVILCGDEIVLHYWRINKGTDWKPTSTSHGSDVDFINFPEKWRSYIIENFKKLNLTTGAFDIAWQDDDLNKEPYFLEVSPFYQPNPPLDITNKSFSYGQFKKRLGWINSWDYLYIENVYLIRLKVFNKWMQ
jgi:glutathione synthase/RimK-type ligase-like ATP-grasp enzyme